MTAQAPRELYVALKPDEAVQAEIRRHAETWTWADNTWRMPAAGYHLSLIEIGKGAEVISDEVEALIRAGLRTVAMEPLDLVLQAPARWRDRAVLCPAPHEGLMALQERLAVHRQQRARKFEPHVTLAHGATRAVPPAAEAAIRWPVREFVLMWFDRAAKTHVVCERYPVNVDSAPPRRKAQVQESLFD